MIFLDYGEILGNSVLLVLALAALLGFRIAYRRKGAIRILLFAISILVLAGSVLIGMAYRLGRAEMTHISSPIYSPDQRHALRIEDDKMDSGSRTTVYLYSGHGIIVNRVFYGTLGSVKVEDIHWLSNSTVLITYAFPNAKQFCASTRQVTVSVGPRSSVDAQHPKS
jgi:hypothetical protein